MIRTVLATLVCTVAAMTAQAEQIVVPVGQQAAYNQGVERPTKGTSKASVEAKYGEPLSREHAVGEPPISSWEYEKFTVYFEYDHVIHSVLKVDEGLLD